MDTTESTPELIVTVASRQMGDNDLEDHVNHYLGHGWRLLHMGQETRGRDGRVSQETVAVLGRPRELPGEPITPEEPGGLTAEDLAGGSLRSLLEDETAGAPERPSGLGPPEPE